MPGLTTCSQYLDNLPVSVSFPSFLIALYCHHHHVLCLVTKLCLTLWDPKNCSPPGSSIHGDYPGKSTGVGWNALLQGIVSTQGLNPGFFHCRWILYHLSHQGSQRILEWVAHFFSSRSSQPRNWTRVSCYAGGFFTSWAAREALVIFIIIIMKPSGSLGLVLWLVQDQYGKPSLKYVPTAPYVVAVITLTISPYDDWFPTCLSVIFN